MNKQNRNTPLTERAGLSYNPPMGMQRQVTKTVGVSVIRSIKAQRDKLSGVLRYAAAKPNWNVVILEGDQASAVRLDARIVLTSRALPTLQGDDDTPAVFVDIVLAANRRRPCVFIDNRAIGQAAAELFLRRGLVNLAAVRYTAGNDLIHANQRIDGFSETAAKAGVRVSVYTPASADETAFLCNSAPFRRWLRDLPKPCGIFGYFDRQTRDILDSCRLARLSIPDQVVLLGVDNETEVCEVTRPTLSSIQPDFEAAGHLAANVLDNLFSHRKVRESYSYGILRLIERESTRPMNAGGRIVSAAMRLMEAADTPPTVAGLARQLHVSTALLNRQFNAILGYGPKEELDRRRLEKVKDLLRDPSRSVAEIADLCRFVHHGDLHRFFRRRTGLTPTQWRERGDS